MTICDRILHRNTDTKTQIHIHQMVFVLHCSHSRLVFFVIFDSPHCVANYLDIDIYLDIYTIIVTTRFHDSDDYPPHSKFKSRTANC